MDSALYVVATPIGNLGDITERALEVLRSVDLIAAEDTRHSAVLLRHFAIETPLTAYHDHSSDRELERIGRIVAEGGSVALISDAGTPMISDPGYRLTRYAHQHSLPVVPIPGASAAIAALSASGLPTDRFTFEGFLPAKSVARRKRLEALADADATMVFYEAPHRVLDTLDDMVAVFGEDREALLARELTKRFETVRQAPLAQLCAFVRGDDNQRRGEVVLLVAGRPRGEASLDAAAERLLRDLAAELPPKRAAAIVAQYTGLKKNALYRLLIEE